MNIETVRHQFKALRLHTAAAELEEVVSEHKKAVSLTWISDLLEREIDARREKALMGRIKRASFPEITTLEGFDWSFNPEINESQIREFATLDFLQLNQICLFLGQPGTGKTHLALAIGVLAANKGYRVYCTTALKGLQWIYFRQSLRTILMSCLRRSCRLNSGFLMTGG